MMILSKDKSPVRTVVTVGDVGTSSKHAVSWYVCNVLGQREDDFLGVHVDFTEDGTDGSRDALVTLWTD